MKSSVPGFIFGINLRQRVTEHSGFRIPEHGAGLDPVLRDRAVFPRQDE